MESDRVKFKNELPTIRHPEVLRRIRLGSSDYLRMTRSVPGQTGIKCSFVHYSVFKSKHPRFVRILNIRSPRRCGVDGVGSLLRLESALAKKCPQSQKTPDPSRWLPSKSVAAPGLLICNAYSHPRV